MRNSRLMIAALLFGTWALPGLAGATTYQVDKDHTNVGFQIRHLFTQVNGRFDDFDGTIDFDPAQPEKAKVKGTIKAASINTNVSQRDNHLRSKDFFDVEKHPAISFESTDVSNVEPAKKSGKMNGKLTIKGVEKPVVLDVAYLGEATDPWGNKKAGFSASTTINRKDFGLNWNETLETGGVLVGEEVKIQLDVEGMVPPAGK